MIAYVLAERYFKSLGWPKLFAVLWIVWLFTGMTFYNYTLDVGWAKGFHKAVDVGYSVGKLNCCLLLIHHMYMYMYCNIYVL